MEKWVLKNYKEDFNSIMERHNVSEVIARLVTNRKHTGEGRIKEYLNPMLDNLHNPMDMKDMEKAKNLLVQKLKEKKKIRIVGDYDVDGVTSTYILYQALLRCGAIVDYEIPDRIKDGYGININIIQAAYDEGVDTLLTCDNGIAALDQVAKAKELGMTVIITDHHDLPYKEFSAEEGSLPDAMVTVCDEELKVYRRHIVPAADAVVNPKRPDCSYPFKGLCGAAVAFKLIQVLYDELGFEKTEAFSFLEIVAIATVCDVMDLVDENRVFVKHGLEQLKKTKNYGLCALMEKNNIHLLSLSAYHLGFIIGPCLNASGRLDTAKKGLELLLAAESGKAEALAIELKKLNDLRKEMTARGVEQALELVEIAGMSKDKVLVVYLEECHESLAGIIAGRLKERYNKPVIILTASEEGVKGSCRSIEAYNIFEELSKCRELLTKFGGHPMAAGLSLKEENIDTLRAALNSNTILTEEDFIPKVSIDIVLPFGYLNEKLLEELEILEPFGKGNSKPVFAEKNLIIRKAAILGKNSNVLKFSLVNTYGRTMEALYFGDVPGFQEEIINNYGKEALDRMFQNRETSVRMSITYYPGINEYGGNRTMQVIIQNYMLTK